MKKLSISLLAGGFILAISSAFVTKPTSFQYFYNDGSCQSLTTDTNCESVTGQDCTILTSSGNTWTLHKTSCTGAVAKKSI